MEEGEGKKAKEKKKRERDEMEKERERKKKKKRKERERNEIKESLSVVLFTQRLVCLLAFFPYSSLYLNPISSLLNNDLVSFTSLFYGKKDRFENERS